MADNYDSIEEINERLKVICPHNDQDQLEREIERVRHEVCAEVFGPDYAETNRARVREMSELFQKRHSLLTSMSNISLNLSSNLLVMPEEMEQHFVVVREKLVSQLDQKLAEIKAEIVAIETQLRAIRCQYNDGWSVVFKKMRERLHYEHDHRFGTPEHCDEIEDLKDRRTRLIQEGIAAAIFY